MEPSVGEGAEQGIRRKGKLHREGKAEWRHVVIKQVLVTVSDSVTPWTALSMEFSGQEYWSG